MVLLLCVNIAKFSYDLNHIFYISLFVGPLITQNLEFWMVSALGFTADGENCFNC